MNIIQGATVRLRGTFTNSDAGALYDPGEVVVIVQDAAGTETILKLSEASVQREALGVFYVLVDTSPVAGSWRCQFTGDDDLDGVGQRSFSVLPAI